MNTTTECPTGCGRVQPRGKFLCAQCWGEVPKHLQDDVYRTWRSYKKTDVYATGFPAISRAYRAARDAALTSIR